MGELVSRCGVKPQTALSHVYDGTLPAGKTGDNLLTGACSGSISRVGNTLAIGSLLSGETLVQPQNKLNDACSRTRSRSGTIRARPSGRPASRIRMTRDEKINR